MKAAIVTIGDEITRGEILDTNARLFAERVTELGFEVARMASTTDDRASIIEAIRQATEEARVVILSGGLGPTEDDRTVDAIAELLGVEPEMEPAALEQMRARFARSGTAMTPNNLRQVRIVRGAEVLTNRAGIAPGFKVRIGEADLFVLPGVPREVERIWADEVDPRLRRYPLDLQVRARLLHLYDLPESHVDHRLAGLAEAHPGISVHYRMVFPENRVKLVVRDVSAERAEALLAAAEADARQRLGHHVYGVDGDSFPAALGRRLRGKGATLALAESCTGGLAAHLCTTAPGSSDWFSGALVVYANRMKQELLGVRAETLEAEGAVSQACAEEMAEGARRVAHSTLAVSVTGIAGPDGGTVEKPVGLVCFGVASPQGVFGLERRFAGDRAQIQARAAHQALVLAYEYGRKDDDGA